VPSILDLRELAQVVYLIEIYIMEVNEKYHTKLTQTQGFKTLIDGIWKNNPAFVMILGICSTLAVTNRVSNGVAMGIAVIFVTCASSITVSLIRNITPRRIRMLVYTAIISVYVGIADQYLRAYQPMLSERMGPYVALIITNCIVMGRAESFASANGVWKSLLDAFGVGLGYTLSLIGISIIREILGFGTIWGYQIIKNWTPWVVMAISPGAFIILGVYIWIFRYISKQR
jgi:Na+-transporting NADH:ubiquinone oxidoreductase subunit D